MQKKLNVAILTGGNVAEREVSLKSAKMVADHLNTSLYNGYTIELNGMEFMDQATGNKIDKNDFSLEKGTSKITFDVVFLMLHGHPAEDGMVQGYFNLLYGIPMADSRLLKKGRPVEWKDLESMGFPLFIKPNKNGSSYGVSKVMDNTCIRTSTQKAFEFDDEVIVEQFMNGREFSNGVFRKGDEIIVLPITEIISENEFFDYAAKYENESEEITPADLTDIQTKECQALSKRLYELLDCKGMARFDYILQDNAFHLLEANTIPGWTEQSFFPQQLAAYGMSYTACLDAVLAEAVGK